MLLCYFLIKQTKMTNEGALRIHWLVAKNQLIVLHIACCALISIKTDRFGYRSNISCTIPLNFQQWASIPSCFRPKTAWRTPGITVTSCTRNKSSGLFSHYKHSQYLILVPCPLKTIIYTHTHTDILCLMLLNGILEGTPIVDTWPWLFDCLVR